MTPLGRLQRRIARVLVARGEPPERLTVTCLRTVTVDPALRPLGEWMAVAARPGGSWHLLGSCGWGETEDAACEALWDEVVGALRAVSVWAAEREVEATRRRRRAEAILALALESESEPESE